MKKSLYILSAILLLSSCTKDLEVSKDNETSVTGDYKISASIESETTKVDIDGTSICWSEGDYIYVAEIGDNGTFNSTTKFTIDKESISEDGKSAEFYGAELEKDKEYIAVNSWAGIAEDTEYYQSLGVAGLLSVGRSSGTQTENGDDSVVESQWLMVSSTFTIQQEDLSIAFRNISSYMELEISMEEGVEDCEIASISFEAPDYIFMSTLFLDTNCDIAYSFNTSSLSLSIENAPTISSSVSYTAYIPFIPNDKITELEGNFTVTISTTDSYESSVTIPARVLSNGTLYTKELQFPAPVDMVASDRAALIDLYNATDGDNWINNDNWCSDAPLSEWYGINTENDRVRSISLWYNNLNGTLPESIGNLTSLTSLSISSNSLTGSIPESIGNLSNLKTLNLSYNSLTGSIPESVGNMSSLENLYLYQNMLSGDIPSNVQSHPLWNQFAWNTLPQQSGYSFNADSYDVYLEPSTVTTIDGTIINTETFFSYNKLTCVYFWASWCWYSDLYFETLKDIYNSYAKYGFEMLSLSEEEASTISSYVSTNNIPGQVCELFDSDSDSDYADGTNRVKYMTTTETPTFAFVDSEGKILFSEHIYAFDDPTMSRENATIAFVEEYFGESVTSTEKYESTDYTKDGDVLTLQTATVGNGIDLVILGDGFCDKDMDTDGVYETRMKEAMEHFFSEEPYKTYRDRYNVYSVKAVSKNDGVNSTNETIFSCEFGSGTFISGDDSKVFEYALKVPSITSTDNLTVITVLNSSNYAGTCYMYYGNDAAIAYCPIVSYDDEAYRQIIIHEAGGHGFAKLMDEYAYTGTIPDADINTFLWQKSIGWGANVDVTDDAETIQWADLLADEKYNGLVGIYEGALTYEYGAYRPTDVSIMRYNTGGYNPPSRKEIYRRIMELSGEGCTYENFVAYDAINRTASSSAYRAAAASQVNRSTFVPLAQPVVVKGSPNVAK